MAIKIQGTTVIDDSRNISANAVRVINNAASAGNSQDPSLELIDGTTSYKPSQKLLSAKDLGYYKIRSAGQLVYTLDNPNAYSTSASDQFGNSVAISGNYAIVGAYQEGDAGGTISGKAYIFNVATGQLIYTLNNPNAYSTSASDQFGNSVAVSEKYIGVAAYAEDDAGGTTSGKVYIFDTATGGLIWTLNNPNPVGTSATDYFGHSISISGNYIIVGAFYEDDAWADSGKAYIFNLATGKLTWQLNNPSPYDISFIDKFGYSVAISGNYAIVGADGEDDAGGESGRAYIFNVATGQLLWILDNPNAYSTSDNDLFGFSVAISGNYAIIGAYGEDDVGGLQSGKAYIYNVVTGQLLYTLSNPNAYGTSAGDYFGHSVAISGNYAIVGAYAEKDAGGTDSGKAYIYNVTTGQLVWTLNNPNPVGTSSFDYFGYFSVAISGNYAIVGATLEDVAGGGDSGKAYIFSVKDSYALTNVEKVNFGNGLSITSDSKLLKQSVPGGALLNTLNNPNAYGTSAGDNFGYSVAISENYAIVGAFNEDTSGTNGTSSGKAYIFNVTTGQLLYTLDNPNAYGDVTFDADIFGWAVAISGKYAIVSARGEGDASSTITGGSGKAYVFNVINGQLLYTLNNPNPYGTSENDYFGTAVEMDGNYAIITARLEDDAGGIESGKAYIYNVTTGALLYTLNNPNAFSTSANDQFGYSVAMSGNYAIVGAYAEGDAGGIESGKAYIFNVTTGQLLYTLNNPNAYSTSASDFFGFSVAISGNYAIVGAYTEDDAGGVGSGKAYIFNVTTGQLLWTLNNPNAYGTPANDYFGYSVAISGNYAIVGAIYEDGAAGTNSGKAYIYNVTTGALVWTLDNPNTYSTPANDTFGISVSISGNYAIVGAYAEDDAGGADSGKAYIFSVKDLTYLDRLVQMVS